jgi:poly(3-hydroxybutyrate) depolymerase
MHLRIPVRGSIFLLCIVALLLACISPAYAGKQKREKAQLFPQDTGFLNRTVSLQGTTYRYQIYVPEQWRPTQSWPIILFLHGRGERGFEGLWQTQVGLPMAVRDHPDRWPFLIVMPQVPFHHYWTDHEMMKMAMAALDQSTREFEGDPQRTYLTGLSMGAYGVWELAKNYRGHFAAIAPVSGGIFWSYAPSRWKDEQILPAEYAARLGRTPTWIFHGLDDPVVQPKQSEIMYDALKANGGDVRLWLYSGVRHNSWDRVYQNPELPRWFLAHHLDQVAATQPYSERIVIPVHPAPVHINPSNLDACVGDYRDNGVLMLTIFRQGETLFQKNPQGEVTELLAENATTFFYPSGSVTRLTFEKDSSGQIKSLLFRDDRHEERWLKGR